MLPKNMGVAGVDGEEKPDVRTRLRYESDALHGTNVGVGTRQPGRTRQAFINKPLDAGIGLQSSPDRKSVV